MDGVGNRRSPWLWLVRSSWTIVADWKLYSVSVSLEAVGGGRGTLYLYCTDTTFTLRPHLRYINILIYEREGKHKQQCMIVLH